MILLRDSLVVCQSAGEGGGGMKGANAREIRRQEGQGRANGRREQGPQPHKQMEMCACNEAAQMSLSPSLPQGDSSACPLLPGCSSPTYSLLTWEQNGAPRGTSHCATTSPCLPSPPRDPAPAWSRAVRLCQSWRRTQGQPAWGHTSSPSTPDHTKLCPCLESPLPF